MQTKTITYLEMKEKPGDLKLLFPENTSIIHIKEPPVHFYRYLYNTVGEEWQWFDRRKLSDQELKGQIHQPGIEIFVLYVSGIPAGYSELDFSAPDNVNLVYFGLMPEFIGKGYGSFFLKWTINEAWKNNPGRLWLHTCTLDAPHALDTYKKAGFIPYKTEEEEIAI
jgi:GNAT superfamily N-acetyltransferase